MAPSIRSRAISAALVLSTLALCALFIAQGAGNYAAAQLLAHERGARAANESDDARTAPSSDTPDALAILRRNAFDISTGSLPKPIASTPAPGVADPPIEQPDPRKLPPPCDPTVKLVGSVYSERSPELSFASFNDGASSPLLLHVGNDFADHEVVAIYPRAVYLRRSDGTLCSLTLFGEPRINRPAPPPPITTAMPAPAPSAADAELDAAITKLSEGRYNVKRAFISELLSDPSKAMRLARVVAHEESGQPVGVKLYGIRRDSLLGKLGLQNGDMLRDINGMSMMDPNAALEAFAALRGASDLQVAITRRGQDTSLGVGITD